MDLNVASWLSWVRPRALRRRGVLGLNERNAGFVLPGNPRAHYPRVDDKLLTKRLCEDHGIPVPQTYAVIERVGDIRGFQELVRTRLDFVIKPAKGAEGRGIVVVLEHNHTTYTTAGNVPLTLADLRYHLETTLSGLFSLGGQPDRAIIERRLVRHPIFERVAVNGTPDIRVLLYRAVPVMAMVRLPTRASRGRANLHQGAVAAGLHLGTGGTFGGVCHDRAASVHPDTGASIAGLEVPGWRELLLAAVKLADVLEMDYLGVDFVLDAELGPVVLEANARPGLAIQIANRRGLLPRLRFVEAAARGPLPLARRLELAAALAEMD
ncbi:MAG: alpha-L-glutamate ligase-like protein [Verrucomicrobia bacterium]|nr:alpha-L-glutamate ligase-like protein [Verrucomicrobiota bacterium]